jgi:hypothetical protein
MVTDAIRAADATTDFSSARAVYLVAEPGVFSRSFQVTTDNSAAVSADGASIRHAAVLLYAATGTRDRGLIAAHETAHILGLPDLYAYVPRGPGGVGWWDPMSVERGGDFLTWHKWKLGWLDAPQVRCVRPASAIEETLTPVASTGGVKAVVVPTGPATAFVVENRQPVGLDAVVCESGALVYRVDATVETGNLPVNVVPSHAEANDATLLSRCGPYYNAPFDLGPGENPVFEDTATGVRIEVLAKDGENLRVRASRR